MKTKTGKKITALFLVFMLLCSVLQPFGAYANALGSIDTATPITKGQEYQLTFEEEEQVHWYKIDSIEEDAKDDSHYQIQLTSENEMNISVYPSLDRAKSDDTYSSYKSYSMLGETGKINFPLAWTGPYYIKVEYYGSDEEWEEEGEEESPTTADYTLSFEGIKLPPSTGMEEEDCPVELSASQKESGKELLKSLRTIRDQVFSQTEQGKEFTSLYYKAAPFIVSKIAFDQKLKDQVYQDLVTLTPLFKELLDNGANSTYKITKKDQDAILRLYELGADSVPHSLRAEMEKINQQVNLQKIEGLRLATVLDKAGMAPDTASTSNKVIVKLKEGKSVSALEAKAEDVNDEATISPFEDQDPLFEDMYIVELGDEQEVSISSQELDMTVDQLENLPEVEYAEPVQEYVALSADIHYSDQWSLENEGGNLGEAGADIKYAPLQELVKEKNLPNTLIAVIDTGVDSRLADLENQVRTDLGYNFIGRNTNALDDNGHGTHVAGIIAAESNNHYSMTGINHAAEIIPIKVLDGGGSGDTESIASGIKYAADQGADVINLSLGGSYSRVIEASLKYASEKGVTIVAASGNEYSPYLSYPASSRYVISVGATNRSDIVSDYSNYGKGLDLVAPGTDIPSLLPNGNVTYFDGTSMAAPHVAAVAGLLLSQNAKLSSEDIQKILTETTDYIAFEELDNEEDYYFYYDDEEEPVLLPGYDEASGWGRLNAHSAVSAVDLNVKVNRLLDNQNVVTGSAKKGTTIEVTNGSETLGSGPVDANGKFKVKIPVQPANQVLYVKASQGAAKASIRIAVEEGKKPKAPKVNTVSNKDTHVTGTTEPNLTVNVKDKNKKVIATGKADKNGAFKVKINKQKENTTLYVTAMDLGNKESKAVKIKVIDKIPPKAPKVNSISDRTTTVKGETEPNATVTIKKNGKKLASGKADKNGKFSIKISKQKAGTKLSITAKDKAGNVSKATTKTVKDKTPPKKPTVNKVTSRDTKVTGKTEANATVTIKRDGKTLASGKADKNGKFSIKISKQKKGTKLSVTAKDKAGNTSKATKVTVQ
ncbi:Ig-like domain-containing protein [Halalkalibacterium halodurans]|uniref:Cell wall-associated protease n=2 Tax=Halalkalibacterium halodurans TaxID=86665 RepID=Q9KB51_HALH5|nr:Ig-like domain-containing protein [Halalkalibacterium halodurans]MED4082455.1 Ig-like domain-containing protein [Halalkalibacterium halodurans]MED4085040.1 Ig-like domain-containing protein [Halalkalibacterium halodurans]MED4107094.1 Ig-like domain-containing protein [Halalkalibacterium halodurans]MED4108700.1 Ig-like domain-containing protein [Halalkalibacterium halodurans]MED4149561.1 Ig-like domain-containing protein [Halalkalibacterium halodurans]